MKMVFEKNALEKTLKDVVRIIPSAARTNLHKFVRITADRAQSRVEFVTTSSDGAIHRNMVDTQVQSPVTIYQSGACLVPARELLEIVKRAKDLVELSLRQNNFDVTVSFSKDTGGKAECDVPGLDPSTFVPYQNDPQETTQMNVTAVNLRSLLGYTLYACSESEARPALTGVNFTVKDDGTLVATSTDGLRLAQAHIPGQVEGQVRETVTIPKTPLQSMVSILPNDDDEIVHLELGHSVLTATWDDEGTRFVLRALDATYPNTAQIIPTITRTNIRVSRAEMLDSCELIALFSGDVENRKTRLDFDNGLMRLSIQSSQAGKAFYEVKLLEYSTPDIDPMMFNVRYWLDLLKVFDTEEIEIGINGQNQPVIIRSSERTAMALVSPVQFHEPRVNESKSA